MTAATTHSRPTGLEITPLGEGIGAEIRGVDLSRPVETEMREALNRALADHIVLVFPGQSLSPAQLLAAGALFGPPMPQHYSQFNMPDFPDICILSSRDTDRRPDGTPIFTLPMVIGLLIFYACCLQCAATLAVIRRETNTWRWPVFAWAYMTTIGYVGAMLAYQLGS